MQLTSLSLALTRAGFLSFSPASLFAAGEPGVWYEPSLTNGTCFQDSSGTTPVTAVEQPVGLILDKSKGLVLGPELVTNGTFDTDSAWAKFQATTTISGGSLNLIAPNAAGDVAAQTIGGLTSGVGYIVKFTVLGRSSGSFKFIVRNATNTTTVAETIALVDGNYALFFVATGVSHFLRLQALNTNTALSIDNISVRELPGNHATQTTSTSRPVLSARYNLLTKTEQFDDGVWTKNNVTVTQNTEIAPDGTMTADTLTDNAVSGEHRLFQSLVNSAPCFRGIYAKAGTASFISLTSGTVASGYAVFDLSNGTVVSQSNAVGSITSVGNGWYLCSTNSTPVGQNHVINMGTTATNAIPQNTYVGSGSTVYIWGASLVTANQADLPYQRVNTSTDYDADPSKFKPYLRFDGVDDWLVTPTITPGTDKAQVFAGVRKLSDGVGGSLVFETSADSLANAGATFLLPFSDSKYYFRSGGSARVTVASQTLLPPITNVLTGLGDISGDSAILRVNGTQAASSTADQGTGNFLAYPLYIGRRGGTTLPFNGHLYGLIVRFGANLPAGTIASTETWLNGKTGAY